MKKYELLKQIIEKVEEYEATELDNLTTKDFAAWLVKSESIESLGVISTENIKSCGHSLAKNETNVEVASLIGYMNRYAKIYTKKALENMPIQSIDEFTYLAILMSQGAMSKTDLITRNVHEKTTGMEIIKRLVKLNLIQQTDDTKDKRSQIINITEGGQLMMYRVFAEMEKVSSIVKANLTASELMTLIALLQKLDVFHRHIYDHEKSINLDSILEKYLIDK